MYTKVYMKDGEYLVKNTTKILEENDSIYLLDVESKVLAIFNRNDFICAITKEGIE